MSSFTQDSESELIVQMGDDEYPPVDPSLDKKDECFWRLVHPSRDEFILLQQLGWYVGSVIGPKDSTRWMRVSRNFEVSPRCPQEDHKDQSKWTVENVREAAARELQEEGWQLANAFPASVANLYWFRKSRLPELFTRA